MKTIPYNKFKHGQRVTCEINGVKIDDAKISVGKNGLIYLCSNSKSGDNNADEKLGYKYSYSFLMKDHDFNQHSNINEVIENLQFLPRTIDDIQEGDVVLDKFKKEITVLGICGKLICFSARDYPLRAGSCYTVEEMKEYGYTLKQDIEEEEKKVGLTITKEMMGNTLYINPDITLSPQDVDKIVYKGKTYILSK